MRKALALTTALTILLSLVHIVAALPPASKTPFFDYHFISTDNAYIADWWGTAEGPATFDIIYASDTTAESYHETAGVIYCVENANLSYVWVYYHGSYKRFKINKVLEAGKFYVVYGTRYYTDSEHYYVALYSAAGEKLYETTTIDYESGASSGKSGLMVKIENGTAIYSKAVFYKVLSSGDAYTWGPLYDALQYLAYDGTYYYKVIRIESYTSPVNVKIYNSTSDEIYEQGFGGTADNPETSYVWINDTKCTVLVSGPAGSKALDITENGLWIVKATDELTDIYKNETTATTEGVYYWLNTTVYPSDYKVEYIYNNSVYSGIGHLEKQFLNNSEVTLRIYNDGGTKLYDHTFTITQNYYIVFNYTKPPTKYYYVEVDVYGPSGDKLTGAYVYIDNKRYDAFTEIRVAEGTHNFKVTASGYKSAEFAVYVDSNMTIPVYLAEETDEVNQSAPYVYNYTAPEPEPPVTNEDWYGIIIHNIGCLLYTSPSPRDRG